MQDSCFLICNFVTLTEDSYSPSRKVYEVPWCLCHLLHENDEIPCHTLDEDSHLPMYMCNECMVLHVLITMGSLITLNNSAITSTILLITSNAKRTCAIDSNESSVKTTHVFLCRRLYLTVSVLAFILLVRAVVLEASSCDAVGRMSSCFA